MGTEEETDFRIEWSEVYTSRITFTACHKRKKTVLKSIPIMGNDHKHCTTHGEIENKSVSLLLWWGFTGRGGCGVREASMDGLGKG